MAERRTRKVRLFLFVCFGLSLPSLGFAFGTDLLGDVTQPILGPTKEKLKGMLVYIWLQPYGGYAFGKGDHTRTTTGGIATKIDGLDSKGFYYGARGGLLLGKTVRLGLDYTIQKADWTTLVDGSTAGTFTRKEVSGNSRMLGVGLGVDVPYTPVQAYGFRYLNAQLSGDSASKGDGWGGGIAFVLKNPFILNLETRRLTYRSAIDPSTTRADAVINQYFIGLSFLLF